jgi:hypothetical protein
LRQSLANAWVHKKMFALFTLFMVIWALEADRRTQLTHEDRGIMKKQFNERADKIRWVAETIKKFIFWVFNRIFNLP